MVIPIDDPFESEQHLEGEVLLSGQLENPGALLHDAQDLLNAAG